MPFVQTTLRRGKTPQYLSNIVESIHRGLVSEFNVPELDKFQVVQQVDPHELVFPASYMGIPHSQDLVYIHITCKVGRTTQMKRNLYACIARLINETTGLSPDDIIIILTENNAENWSFGRGQAQLAKDD